MKGFEPGELRKLTDAAVRGAKEEREKEILEAEEEEAARLATNSALAHAVLLTIPGLARAAALKGNGSACIYRVPPDEGYKMDSRHPSPLIGSVAAFLIEACRQEKLEVFLEFGHDGMGTDSWYDVKVKW